MTVEGEVGMLGRGNTGAALGSEVVDAEFWALICQDEEWLNTEFDEVVSDAQETTTRPTRHQLADTASHRRAAGLVWWAPGTGRPWRTGTRPGRRWRRERGPPRSHQPAAQRPNISQQGAMTEDGDVIERINDFDRRVATTGRLHRVNPVADNPVDGTPHPRLVTHPCSRPQAVVTPTGAAPDL